MQITIAPQGEFPHIDIFKGRFEITDRTVFAWDNVIYSNYVPSNDLITHEITHHRQQKKYGLQNWLEYYIKDDKFRLKMEIEAYRNQLNDIKDRNQRAKLRMELSKHLSSPMYGNIISYEEAVRELK